MATALSIWVWSSPATGAGFVGDGDVDGFDVDGVFGGEFAGAFGGEFVGEAAVRGLLPGRGLVRLLLRDACESALAARSAWSASFGAATVTAFDPVSGVALAGETTFDEAPPILLSTMLAATPVTTVGILDPFAWRPRRGRRCRPDAFPGGWSLSVLFCIRRA
jgi:hypothetical protein